MKRLIAAFTVGLFVLLLISPIKALATDLLPSSGPYMTEDSSTTPVTSFDFNTTPFAYIGFDANNLNTTGPLELTWSWYVDNDIFMASESQRIDDFSAGLIDIWNAPDNWNSIKQVGDWKTAISWENRVMGGKGGWGSQLVNFTVTPEPASAFLFLLGAGAMGLKFYRRKRKVA